MISTYLTLKTARHKLQGSHISRICATCLIKYINPLISSGSGTFSQRRTRTKRRASPLIVGNVQVFVDGEESLFEKYNPLALLLLRLVKDGLHLLHVARSVVVHLLQDLLVAGTDLKVFRTKLANKTRAVEI